MAVIEARYMGFPWYDWYSWQAFPKSERRKAEALADRWRKQFDGLYEFRIVEQ